MISPNKAIEDEQEQLKRDTARLRDALTISDGTLLIGENDENNEFGSVVSFVEPSESGGEPSVEAMTMEDLRRALDLNIEYQATVQSYLELVRKSKSAILSEIEEKNKEVAIEKRKKAEAIYVERFVPLVRRTSPPTLFCFKRPYMKTVYGLFSPPNEDVKMKSNKGENLPSEDFYESGWVWWDGRAKERLHREVRRECLARLLEPHIQYRDELRQLVRDLDGASASEAERDLKEAEETIKTMVRENDNDELYANKSLIERVDWLKVAKKVGITRMGRILNHVTCRLVWCNYYSPLINKQYFKPEEDEKLQEIVDAGNEHNWQEVVEKLGTNRTPFQCLQRFRSKLEPDRGDSYCILKWQPDDEKKLMEVVAAFNLASPDQKTAARYIDWVFVSQNVGNFSWRECCEKYFHLASHVNMGTWAEDETKLLLEAMEIFGLNWVAVATYIGTRSPAQCYRHWHGSVYDQQVKELLKVEPPPEWTAEEDTILWFNRVSKSQFFRSFIGLRQLLPRRHKIEMMARYKILKRWYREAEWLVKNESSLLSLLLKTDAELSLAEVEKLQTDLQRLQTRPQKQKLDESQLQPGMSFTEESHLLRLMNAMVVEASLSRDLVRDKIQLMHDIIAFKAVPIPLIANISAMHQRPHFLTTRLKVLNKIKDLLVKKVTQREKKQKQLEMPAFEISEQMDVDLATFGERGSEFSLEPVLSPKSRLFGKLMSQVESAMKNPNTAADARQTLLQLSSIQGRTTVGKLLKMTRQLDALSRQEKPRHEDRLVELSTRTEFNDYRDAIGFAYKANTVHHSKYSPPVRECDLYDVLRASKRPLKIDFNSVYETAKLLVLALGTNLDGVTAMAMQQRDAEVVPGAGEEDGDDEAENVNKIAAELGIDLANKPLPESLFRRIYAKMAVRALTAPVDDESTARGCWKSIREEFDATANVTPQDFNDNDLPPVLPPCQVSSNAYRVLTMSRLRLREIVNENCDADEREKLAKKVQELKEKPSEAYALLQRRFDALFTWPALISKVMPETSGVRKNPPRTPADVVSLDTVSSSDEEISVPKKSLLTYSRKAKRDPFSEKSVQKRVSRKKNVIPLFDEESLQEETENSIGQGKKKVKVGSAHRSERITEVRMPEKLTDEASARLKDALEDPSRKMSAERQLNFLVPLIPIVPLEDLPFPESRVPKVPKVKKTPGGKANRSFAIDVAERVIQKQIEERQGMLNEYYTSSKLVSPKRRVSSRSKGASVQNGKAKKMSLSPRMRSRTGLKRGRTRTGPSPSLEEGHQTEEKRLKVSETPPTRRSPRSVKTLQPPSQTGTMEVDSHVTPSESPKSSHVNKASTELYVDLTNDLVEEGPLVISTTEKSPSPQEAESEIGFQDVEVLQQNEPILEATDEPSDVQIEPTREVEEELTGVVLETEKPPPGSRNKRREAKKKASLSVETVIELQEGETIEPSNAEKGNGLLNVESTHEIEVGQVEKLPGSGNKTSQVKKKASLRIESTSELEEVEVGQQNEPALATNTANEVEEEQPGPVIETEKTPGSRKRREAKKKLAIELSEGQQVGQNEPSTADRPSNVHIQSTNEAEEEQIGPEKTPGSRKRREAKKKASLPIEPGSELQEGHVSNVEKRNEREIDSTNEVVEEAEFGPVVAAGKTRGSRKKKVSLSVESAFDVQEGQSGQTEAVKTADKSSKAKKSTSEVEEERFEPITAVEKSPGPHRKKHESKKTVSTSELEEREVEQNEQPTVKPSTAKKRARLRIQSTSEIEEDEGRQNETPIVKALKEVKKRADPRLQSASEVEEVDSNAQKKPSPRREVGAKKKVGASVENVGGIVEEGEVEHASPSSKSPSKKRARRAKSPSKKASSPPKKTPVRRKKQAVDKTKEGVSAEPSSGATPVVQRVSQVGTPAAPSTPAMAQFPTSILSNATPSGQAVALIQLNHADVMRLFQGGASSVAIAIALPGLAAQSPQVVIPGTQPPAQNNTNDKK